MSALSKSLTFKPYASLGSTATVAVVYPNTATNTLIYISDKARGSGYYNNSGGLHTVMYVASSEFHGTMTMQATLATDPIENDWFTVDNSVTTYTPTVIRSTSTVNIHNFTGNFVWVRGKIEINDGSVFMIQLNQ